MTEPPQTQVFRTCCDHCGTVHYAPWYTLGQVHYCRVCDPIIRAGAARFLRAHGAENLARQLEEESQR